MPSAVTEPVAEVVSDESKISESRTNRMWVALKAHVLRERARKQQQREAEVTFRCLTKLYDIKNCGIYLGGRRKATA